MSVLVLYSKAPPGPRAAEMDLGPAVGGLLAALPGARALAIEEPEELIAAARGARVVFNAVEAPKGRPELEHAVVGLLEWLGVPFTGSGSETLALCRRKDLTRAVLEAAGVPIARRSGPAGPFPCIVKPLDQDGSAGMDRRSVCESGAEVQAALERLGGPGLVEEFLPGRELNVALWEGPDHPESSVGEIQFQGDLRLVTWAAKWEETHVDNLQSPSVYPAPIPEELRHRAVKTARRAWEAVGGRGYGRVDLRLDAEGRPRVIDVNPNPDISPEAGLWRAVHAVGWSWEQFVAAQVQAAERRR